MPVYVYSAPWKPAYPTCVRALWTGSEWRNTTATRATTQSIPSTTQTVMNIIIKLKIIIRVCLALMMPLRPALLALGLCKNAREHPTKRRQMHTTEATAGLEVFGGFARSWCTSSTVAPSLSGSPHSTPISLSRCTWLMCIIKKYLCWAANEYTARWWGWRRRLCRFTL